MRGAGTEGIYDGNISKGSNNWFKTWPIKKKKKHLIMKKISTLKV